MTFICKYLQPHIPSEILNLVIVSLSGSLLVACSQFGAYVCGTDIDYNIIHGKGELLYALGHSIYSLDILAVCLHIMTSIYILN